MKLILKITLNIILMIVGRGYLLKLKKINNKDSNKLSEKGVIAISRLIQNSIQKVNLNFKLFI